MNKNNKNKKINFKSKKSSLVKKVAGTGKGFWGDSDEYIKKERDSWKKLAK